MRKDFYIFRHGETDYNKEKRWQGCGIDTELNETGLQQARNLVGRLQDKRLQVIYSSGLKRALKTAQIIGEALDLDVNVIPDLREASFGTMEGKLKDEVAFLDPEVFSLWYDKDAEHLDVSFPGGETKLEIHQRMFRVLTSLLETREQIIGIASHGSSIRYLLLLLGKTLGRMENTALYHLVYEGGVWRVEEEG